MKKTLMIILLGILCLSMCISIVPKVKAESTVPVTGSASVNTNSPLQLVQPIDDVQPKITESRMTGSELQRLESTIGVDQGNQTYNQIINGHGTGLAPPSKADWEKISSEAFMVSQVSSSNSSQLPSEVDNSATSWFPPIGNQGSQGSCVAWAVGYYINTFEEAKEHGWNLSGTTTNEIMSPSFVYNLIDGGVDEGSSFYDAIQLVCSVGECSLANMPYNQGDCTSWPSESAWQEAPFYRGGSTGFETLNVSAPIGILSLKSWIASGNLAVIGVDANQYVNLTNNYVWTLDNYNNPVVDHANTIVGYDDNFTYTENGQLTEGAFKVANSWGTGFGAGGFYWISYQAMSQRIGYVMFYQGRTGYVPKLTCSFRISHPFRGDCSILVGMGTHDNPTASKSFTEYINGGNQPFCSNNIVFDITEFTDVVSNVYGQPFFLSVYDGGTNVTGTVLYFSVGDTVSASPPVATVDGGYVFADLILGQPSTTVFLTPYRISGIAGQTVTVYANVTDVTELSNYQIGLTWSNVTVAQCTSVAIGNIFNIIPPADILTLAGNIDNTHGIVTPYMWAAVDTLNVTGSGTLAAFTFKVTHTGYSDVHMVGMILFNANSKVIPCNTVDYFTSVRGGNQYIVEIQGDPSESSTNDAGFYEERVTQMIPATVGGVSGLIGNMTFAINGTSKDNGASGYFNVTIPNNLMNCSGNNAKWIVELNNGTGPVLESKRTVMSGHGTTTISLSSANFYPSGTSATSIVNIYSTNIAAPPFTVTVSPVSVTLDVNQSQTLTSVIAGGISPYSYQWYLNGTPVSGATGVSWTFTPASPSLYSIYLNTTDAVGAFAESNAGIVTVHTTPSVSNSPNSATLDTGQSQQFTSSVSGGTSPFTYQWFLNNVAVPSANSTSWKFTAGSSGIFEVCVNVTDSVDFMAESNTVSVMVNRLPSVSVSPTSVTLDVDKSQVFTSSVSGGTSPYTYQWYQNGTAIVGATGSSYNFTPFSNGHYNFYVNVTDSADAKAESNTAKTTVNNALYIIISPSSVTLDADQSRTFISTASGGTSPFSYQWYLNGSAVSGATNSTWTFTPSSTGSYDIYVTANDTVGMVATSKVSTVTVISAIPEFPTAIPLALMLFIVSTLILTLRKRHKPT